MAAACVPELEARARKLRSGINAHGRLSYSIDDIPIFPVSDVRRPLFSDVCLVCFQGPGEYCKKKDIGISFMVRPFIHGSAFPAKKHEGGHQVKCTSCPQIFSRMMSDGQNIHPSANIGS